MFTSINLDLAFMTPDDLKTVSATLKQLSMYADIRSEILAARLSGNIESAKIAERKSDVIYASLPEWAKW